jgi:hypothetical protein
MSAKPVVKNFNNPDEAFDIVNGRAEINNLGGKFACKTILKPGWKWSESIKPMAQTDSCEINHLLTVLSGTMKIRMNDGTEYECKAGDSAYIPAGHDAWVVGDEDVVTIDFDDKSAILKKAK